MVISLLEETFSVLSPVQFLKIHVNDESPPMTLPLCTCPLILDELYSPFCHRVQDSYSFLSLKKKNWVIFKIRFVFLIEI